MFVKRNIASKLISFAIGFRRAALGERHCWRAVGWTAFRAAAGRGATGTAPARPASRARRDLPATANLGFVYASDPLADALDLIGARLPEATGVRDWVGTGGAAVCGSGREHTEGGAIVALVASLPEAAFACSTACATMRPTSTPGSPAVGRGTARRLRRGPRRSAPRRRRAARSPAQRGSGAFLVGGLSSASGSPLQIAGRPTEGGLSGRADERRGAADHRALARLHADRPGPRGDREPGAVGAQRSTAARRSRCSRRRSARCWRATRSGSPATSTPRCRCRLRSRRLRGAPAARDRRASAAIIAIGDDLRRGDPLLFVKRDGGAAQADLRRMLDDLLRPRRGAADPRRALSHLRRARAAHVRARFGRAQDDRGGARPGAARRLLHQRRDLSRPAVWLHRRADPVPVSAALPERAAAPAA